MLGWWEQGIPMKLPKGEHVQLDFYFHGRSCTESIQNVVRFCVNHGGRVTGEIVFAKFDNARRSRVSRASTHPIYDRSIDEQELWQHFIDEDICVLTVGVKGAIGIKKNGPEIVTTNGVSDDAPLGQTNPVSIVAQGWQFSTPGFEKERQRLARKYYDRFIAICDDLHPTYAAILNEDSLSCPYDLRKGEGDYSFADFFISEQAFGADFVSRVEAMYADAYTKRLASGLYVSTWMFSPKHFVLDRKNVQERSTVIARMLAGHLEGE